MTIIWRGGIPPVKFTHPASHPGFAESTFIEVCGHVSIKSIASRLGELDSKRHEASGFRGRGVTSTAAREYEELAQEYFSIGARLHGIDALVSAHACRIILGDQRQAENIFLQIEEFSLSDLTGKKPGELILEVKGTQMTIGSITKRLDELQELKKKAIYYYQALQPRDATPCFQSAVRGYLGLGETLHAIVCLAEQLEHSHVDEHPGSGNC